MSGYGNGWYGLQKSSTRMESGIGCRKAWPKNSSDLCSFDSAAPSPRPSFFCWRPGRRPPRLCVFLDPIPVVVQRHSNRFMTGPLGDSVSRRAHADVLDRKVCRRQYGPKACVTVCPFRSFGRGAHPHVKRRVRASEEIGLVREICG
jgi:hypothetical protein